MTNIHDLTLNLEVLVQREGNTGQSGSWEGLYKLVVIHDEDCVLALPRGNMTFHSTSVKPFHVLDVQVNDDDLELGQNNQGNESNSVITKETPVPVNPLKRGRG